MLPPSVLDPSESPGTCLPPRTPKAMGDELQQISSAVGLEFEEDAVDKLVWILGFGAWELVQGFGGELFLPGMSERMHPAWLFCRIW